MTERKTEQEYDKLTEKEIQIKVAELDGWIISVKAPIGLDGRFPWLHPKGDPENPERYYLAYGNHNLPDYLHDLNACHGFEMKLTRQQKWWYYDALAEVCDCMTTKMHVTEELWKLVSATAAQRCKAFVLTMAEGSGEV